MRKRSMGKRVLIHALIISDSNGRFLVDIIRNPKLESAHLSGFISALKMFGEETLGEIGNISISGLDIDLLTISKHNLIMVVIMDSDLPDLNFKKGCERALDSFYEIYNELIPNWKGSLKTFRDFREILTKQIELFFDIYREYRIEQKSERRVKGVEEFNPEVSSAAIITALENELSQYERRFLFLQEHCKSIEEENRKLKEEKK